MIKPNTVAVLFRQVFTNRYPKLDIFLQGHRKKGGYWHLNEIQRLLSEYERGMLTHAYFLVFLTARGACACTVMCMCMCMCSMCMCVCVCLCMIIISPHWLRLKGDKWPYQQRRSATAEPHVASITFIHIQQGRAHAQWLLRFCIPRAMQAYAWEGNNCPQLINFMYAISPLRDAAHKDVYVYVYVSACACACA